MTGNIVARRYAQALFSLGKKKGLSELEAFGKDLQGLADACAAQPELLRVFANPIFSVAEKKAIVGKLASGAGATVKNFCSLLADKGRLDVLPDIQAVFGSLLDVEKGVVKGEMVTAVELKDDKQKALLAQLEKQSGKKLVLDYSVDPSILGGVVVKIGENVMDASLRAQLNILKETIKRGE